MKSCEFFKNFIILIIVINQSFSSRILGIFPEPSPSHQLNNFGLMKTLADRGHKLTILSSKLQNYNNQNVTQIHVEEDFDENCINQNPLKFYHANFYVRAIQSIKCSIDLKTKFLNNRNFINFIKNSKKSDFDVIIMEPFFPLSNVPILNFFDCPIIHTLPIEYSNFMVENIGNEINPTLYPCRLSYGLQDGSLNFIHRLSVYILDLTLRYFFWPISEVYHDLSMPKSSYKIANLNVDNRVQMLFINSLVSHRPSLPNVVPLRFMHVYPPSELPESKFKKFLNEAENGVIYMSLGTICKSVDIGNETLDIFIKTFEQLKYRVLWKFEGEIENLSSNVMTFNWLPQADVLAHPNILAFISQGGLMSIQESIDREIPMILFPLAVDQPRNALTLEEKEVALKLDLKEISQKSLSHAINEIVKPRYKENMKKLKKVMLDKPISDREVSVFNVEYVIRNKYSHYLKSNTRNVQFYVTSSFDMILSISMMFSLLSSLTRAKNYVINYSKNGSNVKVKFR